MADKKLSESIKKFQKTVTSVRGGPLRGGVKAKKKSVKMQGGGMAGASPAEIRDEKERQRKESRKRASQRRDGQKMAKPSSIDKIPGKTASAAEQARDLGRAAEIDRLRREEAKKRQERARASRATVGMGPSKVTTGGGLGTMTQRDRSKPKMLKEGGAVPAEFKGFSKLPEKVQQKMNPDLAQKYENGGEVRGARSAISGRGFKGIR